MKIKKSDERIKSSIFSIYVYLIFFLLTGFIATCCILLLLNSVDITLSDIRGGAIMTFGNVLFLSFLFTIIDALRRKYTVERPVKRILETTYRLTQGDLSARIKPLHAFKRKNEFDIIIDDLNKMAEELSGIDTLRNDFIASVSHELKTPLAVIQNCSTMLQAPGLCEEKRLEYAKTIGEATRKFSELITNILKLNKLENQKIFSEVKAYDLGEQLRTCLLDFEDTWEKKNLDIQTDIEDVTIAADEELLTLVWNNLFSNAIKFTEPDGIVSVSLKKENENIVVTVKDTGCGISSETGKHIFEKFYQGDSSHATQGNGLGLALVKQVVDIIGGEIAVESSPGEGTIFTVILKDSQNNHLQSH